VFKLTQEIKIVSNKNKKELSRTRLTSVANSLQLKFQHIRKLLCCFGAMSWRWAPQTGYMLRYSTASIMKG